MSRAGPVYSSPVLCTRLCLGVLSTPGGRGSCWGPSARAVAELRAALPAALFSAARFLLLAHAGDGNQAVQTVGDLPELTQRVRAGAELGPGSRGLPGLAGQALGHFHSPR